MIAPLSSARFLFATISASVALFLCHPATGFAQAARTATTPRATATDQEIAVRFAPLFYQGLGDDARGDYLTNFDFDGDWRGDNNWQHAADSRFLLKAYVYYAVCETRTHFFVHYAIFHPRDYKGGRVGGTIWSEIIREGTKQGGKYDPTGLAREVTLAHENDMEGCLVVAEKRGGDELREARVVYVETLSHNRFLRYVPERAGRARRSGEVKIDGQRSRLYVEPKGHGIEAYRAGTKQGAKQGVRLYVYDAGQAGNPESSTAEESVSYALLPIYTTLWPRAQRGVNETFGAARDYGTLNLQFEQAGGRIQERPVQVGKIGSAFLGAAGSANRARPPWGWFDRGDRHQPPGEWFFDPAATVKRRLRAGDQFATVYVRHSLVK